MGVSIIKEKYPEIHSLRDVDENKLSEFKTVLPEIIYTRCKYVVEENTRVLNAVKALSENRLKDFGDLMYTTHHGLSKEYEVSCPELDFLVEYSKKNDSIIGSRMMGGGFGGCTINLIHKDAVIDFKEKVSIAYFEKFNIKLDIIEANPDEGTRVIK